MSLTINPNHPKLGRGIDQEAVPQNEVYLVLSDDEIAKGFVRPYRDKYVHSKCGGETKMGQKLSETYACNPKFYGATYCVHCLKHLPVNEFRWSSDDTVVGS
jgi:hypothetical protein